MRPSLLVITPRYPYPVVGGDRLRIYHICKALSTHFDLSLLSLCDSHVELYAPLPVDKVFSTIERVYWPKWRSWISALSALPSRLPLQVAYYHSPLFVRRIEQLARQHDAVFSHLIRVGASVRLLDKPKFLEMTDAISLNYARLRSVKLSVGGFLGVVYRMEESRLHDYEQAIVHDFDASFLVSEVDRGYLLTQDRSIQEKLSVIGNGVDLTQLPYQFQQEAQDLVFIGNMSTLPNLDAVHHFLSETMPLVHHHFPAARLRVIGRISASQRSRLEKFPHVVITGEVSSVAAFAQGAAVGICPMRVGAGVQNKLLEYMALGLPAVTTRIGLEGLAAHAGRDVLVADSSQEQAEQIILLLRDRKRAQIQAQAARRYVEAFHSWDAVLAPMVATISQRLSSESHLDMPDC